ncbi:MAG: hypothetical protein A3D44_02780 [Candidatus Staskawiczbacteria bacterium RIFCSPHIGHO2_02_FULL_42_22]|uniref:UDP-N-acetylmuramoyl-L-alanyl-D-glutamate--2, 6-diaminopimelate ligase n=1 Tax=Candidatus Staskawiczbacteria bacterium RIFCSPHIGHO2_02_FULL_42_22 TaxID=1802207 RepID=A0A1G2I5M5_9BACT|nr:MAG: hypothetical protein A3D44_02780 [Candidatus Staskawiczbacteria bacterium RIFCSPHIGHO2_02_FULL_42_22]
MNVKRIIKKITPHFLLDFYYWLWAFLGALMYGLPSRKLTIIGVTGTSGKSTTVDFISKIFEENGDKVASISSVRFRIAGEAASAKGYGGPKEWKNQLKMTMPGRFIIQKFLRQAVREKCKYAILEVTSEGIKQFRHKFISIDTAVFTNLSPEHIEAHGGFENYRNEKLKLFKVAKSVHVINVDDQNAQYFLKIPAKKRITFGLEQGEVNLKNTHFNLQVLGSFNHYNALAAISVAVNYGVSLEMCKKALEKVTGIPGRMEVVSQNPLVVVDYAHTPDQLEKVYRTFSNWSENPKPQTLNPKQIQNTNNQNSKLICVLGSCGGGRDKWKRPVLGRLAAKYCKEIIITNEDPYDENPLSIINEIESGFSQTLNSKYQILKYEKILDRREAIKKALQLAKPEDSVIITGKGSEVWMCVAEGKKIPWSDVNIVKEELLKINK